MFTIRPERGRPAAGAAVLAGGTCWAANGACFGGRFTVQRAPSDVEHAQAVGGVREVSAHGLRPAVRPGLDGRGGRDTFGWPGGRVFVLVVAAMVCARTCAMAFNRIVDRRFDAANRARPDGICRRARFHWRARGRCGSLAAAGFIAASWLLNRLCFYLSPVALFVVCFYSVTKRFTDYTHVFLGVALALAPLGAWIAVTGGLDFLRSGRGRSR